MKSKSEDFFPWTSNEVEVSKRLQRSTFTARESSHDRQEPVMKPMQGRRHLMAQILSFQTEAGPSAFPNFSILGAQKTQYSGQHV